MSSVTAGILRRVGLMALMVGALGGTGASWAQQRPGAGPTCDKAKASACTDQKVVACQSAHKGNQSAIGQCQMDANMACYQQYNCPTSAR